MKPSTQAVELRQEIAYSLYYARKHARYALLMRDHSDVVYQTREAVSWAREAITAKAVADFTTR